MPIDTLCPCGNDTEFSAGGRDGRLVCARCGKPLSRRDQSLELLFARLWVNRPPDGLPDPIREYPTIAGKRKNQPHRADFAWPDHKVSVEIDGGQWAAGGGSHNTDADRDKLNRLIIAGWRPLRFSGSMLKTDPARCIAQVVALLRNAK